MQVQEGDFCVIPIHGVVGKLVSIGEWLNGQGFKDYDHAEVYYGHPDNNGPFGYTISDYPGGARKIPLYCPPERYPHALWSSDHIPLTQDQRDLIVSLSYDALGTPYSALDYFALAAHRFNLPIPWLKHYIASSKHMICSQFVDFVYTQAGVPLFKDGRWPGYVTPADLAMRILGSETI